MASQVLGGWVDLEQAEVAGVTYLPGAVAQFIDLKGRVADYILEKIGYFAQFGLDDMGPCLCFRHTTDREEYRPVLRDEFLRLVAQASEAKTKTRRVFVVRGEAYNIVTKKVKLSITAADEMEAAEIFESYVISHLNFDGLREDEGLSIEPQDEDETSGRN